MFAGHCVKLLLRFRKALSAEEFLQNVAAAKLFRRKSIGRLIDPNKYVMDRDINVTPPPIIILVLGFKGWGGG